MLSLLPDGFKHMTRSINILREGPMRLSKCTRLSLFLILLLAAASFFTIGSVQAYPTSLKIVAVYPSSLSTPYDKPVTVDIFVEHNSTTILQVTIYYASFIDMTMQRGGWRIAQAQLVSYNTPPGYSLFTVYLPSTLYHETLPYLTKIVFYVEARDSLGNIALSCREADRWDFTVQEDKHSILLEDPYPPAINQSSIKIVPEEPTSIDEVAIIAMISDDVKLGGSGIGEATIHYSTANGRDWKSTPMNPFKEAIWEGTIPAQPKDTRVIYYIKAIDLAGNSVVSDRLSYQVLPSWQEVQQQYLTVSAALAFAAIFLVILGLAFRRRIIPYISQRKAAVTVFSVALIILSSLLYWFVEKGRWLWPIFVLIVLTELWSLTNPNIRSVLIGSVRSILEYLSRVFGENPPTALIAACYALGFAGAAGIFILVMGGIYDLEFAYRMANLFATYIFYLLVAGVLGQLLLLAYKGRRETKERSSSNNWT